MTQAILEAKNLTKTFKDANNVLQVFNKINFDILKEESCSIIGASGSGKSTLLHILGGIDQPTNGEVNIYGKNIFKLSANKKAKFRNQHLGFAYQFHHLLPELTALENVKIVLDIGHVPTKEAVERAREILNEVGLADRLHHKPKALSGGQRQRVALARALVNKPKIVLADEPTGNLDAKNAQIVMDLFFKLQQKHKNALVIVTHDIQIASLTQACRKLEDGCLSDRILL